MKKRRKTTGRKYHITIIGNIPDLTCKISKIHAEAIVASNYKKSRQQKKKLE